MRQYPMMPAVSYAIMSIITLRFAKQKGHKSLFVHVPLFSRIDEATHMQFVASLLEAIVSTC